MLKSSLSAFIYTHAQNALAKLRRRCGMTSSCESIPYNFGKFFFKARFRTCKTWPFFFFFSSFNPFQSLPSETAEES